jgi:PAS domain S-box-containing protein
MTTRGQDSAVRLIATVRELSLARSESTVMVIVSRAARELIGADGATFVIRDGDQCFYADEEAISPLWKGKRFPMKACISGWVMLHGEPVTIRDIYDDPRIPADAYRPTFVKSLAMVPIRAPSPVGAIGAYWARRHGASDGELEILQALADSVSVTLENLERTRALEEARAQLAATAAERSRVSERSSIILETLPNGVIMVDRTGTITLCNTETERLFGYRRDELIGQSIETLVPDRFHARHPEYREGFFRDPKTRAMGAGRDLFGRRKDGGEFPIEIGLNPVATDEGQFVLAAIVDITERKAAEERFRAVVESTPNALLIVDPEGRMTLVNSQAETMFGYRRQELLGQPIEMLVPERFRSRHPGFREAFFRDPKARPMGAGRDLRGLCKDGREIPVEIGLKPMQIGGRPHVLAAVVDISARRRLEEAEREAQKTEQALRSSEARKAAILDSSLEAIVSIDHNGLIIEWNGAAERTFGRDRTEVLGKELAELVIPERFRVQHRQGLGHFLETGDGKVIGKRIEMPALHAKGHEFPLELSITAIPGGDGPPIFTASARDITTRVHAEAALKKNQERLRRVIEAAPNGLLMVDREGKITLCNAEVESLFGYGRDEMIGRPIEMLVPERFRPKHPSYRTGFFDRPVTRQMGAGRDLFGLHSDGREFPVEIGLNPLETDEGIFVLASIVDITKRKALEDDIRSTSDALKQKNLEMEQFIYTVSHDLKSPIVTSLSFIQFVRDDLPKPVPEEIDDSLTRLEKANRRMAQLIDDLLRLSRVGRLELKPEDVDVTALVTDLWRDARERFKDARVEVEVEVAAEMPHIRADRARLTQVFENLLNNALKYGTTGPSPRIEVGAVTGGGEVRYFVRDNGRGVAPDFHRRIFALFERLEANKDGTGVGLAIVTRVAELHGGRAWVESTPGQGATFWIAFPAPLLTSGLKERETHGP